MRFITTDLPDVIIVEPQIFGDERGFFMETYHSARFAEAGICVDFKQDNHSGSRHGILRGLHYQIHQTQGKLVRVVAGEVYDVAVDIRRGSATFGRWVGKRLSAQNRLALWVPAGFAHGFFTISDWAEVVYKATDFYAPEWERCIRWDDPGLNIDWPLQNGESPIVSAKDAQGKFLIEAEVFD